MVPRSIQRTPAIEFLEGLGTVRDNPYLVLLARRHARERRHLRWSCAFVGVLGLAAWSAAALLAGRADAGRWVAAILATVEFHLIFAIARETVFSARLDLGPGASVDVALAPIGAAREGGMRRTYALLVATGLALISLPVHVGAALVVGGDPVRWLWCQVVCILAAVLPGVAAVTEASGRDSPWAVLRLDGKRDSRLGPGLLPLALSVLIAIGPASASPSSMARSLLFPDRLVDWLSTSHLWRWSLPAGLLLVCALPYAVSLRERTWRRYADGRAETIRVWPWSFGLTSTVPGLTLLLGYLWPAIASGVPARYLGLPATDVSRSAEGTLTAMFAGWCLAVGLLGRAGHAVSYGLLRSPREHVDPLPRGRAWLHELGWMVEAGLSVHVPLMAFALAWTIGGDVPWPSLAATARLAGCAAAICAGAWGLTRAFWWLREWRGLGHALALHPVLLSVAVVGVALTPPVSHVLLGLHPLTATLWLTPGLGAGTAGPLGSTPGVQPDSTWLLAGQLACASAGVALGAAAWSARRGRRERRPCARVEATPTSERFARVSLMERLSGNPIAVRHTRGRWVQSLEVTQASCIVLALVIDAVWAGLLGWSWLSPLAPWAVQELSLHPAPIALLASPFLFLGPLLCCMGPGNALLVDLTSGTLGATCLTPMSDAEILGGYVDRSRYAAQVMLPGAAMIVPLCFVGASTVLVAMSFGSALLLAVPYWRLGARLSLLEALRHAPPLESHAGDGRRPCDIGARVMAGLLIWLVPVGLVAQPIALFVSHGPWANGLGQGCIAATLALLPALLFADRWAKARLMAHFGLLRQEGLPLAPFARGEERRKRERRRATRTAD